MADESFHLEWHGPYAIVDGANNPNLVVAKPAVSLVPGVYVWTVPIGDDYWVHNIGKTEDQKDGLLGKEHGKKGDGENPGRLGHVSHLRRLPFLTLSVRLRRARDPCRLLFQPARLRHSYR